MLPNTDICNSIIITCFMKFKPVLFSVMLLGAILSVGLLGSCAKTTKCGYATINFTVPDSEVTAVKKYTDSLHVSATKDPRGFYYIIESSGDRVTASLCDNVSFTYVGMLTNGNVFDSSSTPVTYQLGGLILGWQWALPSVGQGGKIRMFLPPSLGYGYQDRTDNLGNVVIPKGSILDFDVTVTAVKK
jgi:FKBP-type peptidyl-prolyl cis-trans isomerase FkpA